MRRLIVAALAVVAALSFGGRPVEATVPVASTAPQKTMYVSISGVSEVATYWSCTWTAYVSGGTAPYTFQWGAQGMIENWSSGEQWNGYAAHGGNVGLNVLVTDATGQSAWGYFSIYSSSNSPFCTE